MDTAILMEIENLRRESLAGLRAKYWEVFHEEPRSRYREHLFRQIAWRLQALVEGDLSERARARAQEIAQDADLRMVAPQDFFTVGGARIQTVPGDRSQGTQGPPPADSGYLAEPELEGAEHPGGSPAERIPV